MSGKSELTLRHHSPSALLGSIDQAVEALRHSIGALESRLGDVLRLQEPECGATALADETMSPIAGDLLRKLRQIEGLDAYVASILSRIDI